VSKHLLDPNTNPMLRWTWILSFTYSILPSLYSRLVYIIPFNSRALYNRYATGCVAVHTY
jgi:hypothetical protein